MKKKAKKKKKKIDILDYIKTNYLLIIFCLLLCLVIFLGWRVILLKNSKNKQIKGDMLIPIVSESFNYEFYIDGNALNDKDGYILRLCNYKDDKVISNDISYRIEVVNESNLSLQVTKNNNVADLLSKGNVIEDSFKSKKMDDHLFYIKLLDNKNLSNKSKIKINIYKA